MPGHLALVDEFLGQLNALVELDEVARRGGLADGDPGPAPVVVLQGANGGWSVSPVERLHRERRTAMRFIIVVPLPWL